MVMAQRHLKRRSPMLFALAVLTSIAGWLIVRTSVLPTRPIRSREPGIKPGRSYETFTSSPHSFVDAVVDCFASDTCHVFYHHVQKTGGSSVASRLFPIVEHREYNSSEWCCNEKFLDRFRRNPHDYCSRNLSVYEVKAPQYYEILETCRRLHPSHDYLALVSIREPIQRTLSMIHHQCNKNFGHKKEIEQSICANCTYTPESAWFWNQFTNQTNTIYRELKEMLQNDNQQRLLQDQPIELTWLFLDNLMIDTFLDMLKLTMNVELTWGKANKEHTHVCNFGMPSRMMRDLHSSHWIYAGLLGRYMPEYP